MAWMRQWKHVRLAVVVVVIGVGILFGARVVRNHLIERAFRKEVRAAEYSDTRAEFESYKSKLELERMLDLMDEEFPLCHGQAHALGRVVFNQTRDLASSFEICRDHCTGGCFHGVLMEAFKDVIASTTDDAHIALADLKPEVVRVCDEAAIDTYYSTGNCAHGMGHVFSYLAGYDISRALSYCALFPEEVHRYYCTGGMFMEYHLQRGDADIVSKSLLYPCDTYGDFPAACFRYKMPYLLRTLGGLEHAVRVCESLKSGMRLGCFSGVGFAYLHEIAANPALFPNICGHGTMDDQRMCIDGAIEKIADYDKAAAVRACGRLDPAHQLYCLDSASKNLYRADRDMAPYRATQ